MNLAFSESDEAFRDEVRTWLNEHLVGEFAACKGRGGLGDMDAFIQERIAWEKELASGGWTCVGWPKEHGGRGATLYEEVIFAEEYARAQAPGRAGHIGEGLLGPTIIHFGTPEQQQRFLPPIVAGEELWCQGYSEPGAGSDLANVQTKAVRAGDEWVLTGQKIWTSLAEFSDWCFVLARTDSDAPKHKGITCMLVPMNQPGIEVVPIRQMTGNSEFAEVFFDGARAKAEHVVGPINGGWKVAMGTLAFERGASTLGQQLSFAAELDRVIAVAKKLGTAKIPAIRDRIAELWMRLSVMRLNALRTLSAHERGELPREAYITKLFWATWHRDLGELAMDVLGARAAVADPEFEDLHRLFLWTRSDTIYAGTNQIQRNLIAQRALGLPR
ncbi:MAG: acyl-CoA dehydrogenase family protein [Proteobacteria bacterium]|nr:acyl-CoA dehydrogenase family protein [Pseudomonadota bacterium]